MAYTRTLYISTDNHFVVVVVVVVFALGQLSLNKFRYLSSLRLDGSRDVTQR